MTARRVLLDGLARDADIFELVSELAPLHPRDNTFPGEVFLRVAADALDWCGASRADPLPLEGLRERFLPECTFRGRENTKLQYAVLAAAALHGGTEPDLLDEVAWWQTDDFWQYALFAAVASAWMEGRQCPLSARGYSRDGKKGRLQIEYGLLTDPAGRPVAVRVFPATPATQRLHRDRDRGPEQVRAGQMVMVGDRGMITSPGSGPEPAGGRDGPAGPLRVDHRAARPRHRKLMAEDGPLQLSLFDQQDLAEITSGDFPGERLVACRNPVLAADRARKREDLLAATEKLLAPIIARVAAGRLHGAGEIGVEAGKVISNYKTGKHFDVTITDTSLTVDRRQDQIDAEAALDGFYVLRTPVPAAELDAPAVVTAYKNLKYVERDFRHIKADDLDLRPVFHRLEERVRAHVLICMLACYLTWHLRRAWAPLTFTDETRPPRATPSPRPAAPPPRRPRPPASTTRPGSPTAASAACSSTWPP